ncbi:MAG TPA: hypothetical protein VFB62_05930, partial [Polyangiaceae bacterium]|nr:hypothetical protein [Polyangiaceae bacterium]
LVGEPLREGESAAERMRLSELTLVATGDKSEWPNNCGDLVTLMLDKVEKAGSDASVSALRTPLGRLKGTSAEMYVSDAKSPLVNELFTAAREAGLEPPPANAPKLSPGATAPPAALALARDKMVELGESDGYSARVELAPGSSTRFILGTSQNKKALYCRFDAQKQPLEKATCKQLARLPSIVSRPLSTESNGADYYFDTKPQPAVWGLDGSSVVGPFGPSTFVYENGMIADIFEDPAGPKLVRPIAPGGLVEQAAMPKVPGGRWLGFRAGATVWRGPVLGNVGKSAIMVQDVGSGRSAVGGKIDLELVPPDIRFVEACRDGAVLTLAIVGEGKKPGDKNAEHTVSMIFRDEEGKWSGSKYETAVFSESDWDVSWWRTLGCKGKEGTFTYASGPRIGQIRCTPEACTKKESGPIPGHDRMQKLRVGDLGGKALLVRILRAKVPIGGVSEVVSMRWGPPEKLASTPEQVILGDDDHLGLPQLGKSLGLVQANGAAVVFFHSGNKIYGVHLDAAGKASKLATK